MTARVAPAWEGNRWVGRRVPRVEDPPLLTGRATFVSDLTPPRTLHAAFVRSPIAAGRIVRIDASEALRDAGAVAVLVAEDLDLPGMRAVLERPDFVPTTMPLLAARRVRHAGDPVAIVLAEDPYAAEDAAEAVLVDYDVAAPVVGLDGALAEGAPIVHEEAGTNVLVDALLVDDPEMAALLEGADLRIDAVFTSARVAALPLEGRASLAEWDARAERLMLTTSTQCPHLVRTTVAEQLGLPEGRVRVVAPDVGGGFGQKAVVAREEVVVAAAAYRLRRPVKWVEDRRENLTSSFHGHEQRHRVSAAFTADGRLLGLDAEVDCDIGAYSSYPFSCAVEPLMAASEMPGPYRLPRYRVRSRGIATNKVPMAPYRGVSRPQIVLVMERLMDMAAARLGLSRVDVRTRNLIRDEDFPYTGVNGVTYDAGSYRESLERCAEALDLEGWPERQAEARSRGRLLGLGFACFSERTGYGTPTFASRGMTITPGYDTAEIRMDPTGGVTVAVGTSGHGQGHRTTLAQVVADELGLDVSAVRVIQGDTDVAPYGYGTFASRTAVISGGSSQLAAQGLADKLRRIAGHVLEADPGDIVLRDGRAAVRGSPEPNVAVRELARIAHHAAQLLPEGELPGLEHVAGFDPPGTFSNATHGVVVEVDPGTGGVEVRRYVVVEDCGVVLNPMIVDGQVRGGIAQGIACALLEEVRYDDGGQCQSATLIDYLAPTATEIPRIEVLHLETPSEHSGTGAKGMGEGGTIGAPAAVANAVTDALAHVGFEVTSIPVRPEQLLRALAGDPDREGKR